MFSNFRKKKKAVINYLYPCSALEIKHSFILLNDRSDILQTDALPDNEYRSGLI